MTQAAPIHWPAEALWQAIAPLLPGFSVEILPEIDSTNTELMRRARVGRTEPTLLVAERQTAGRGRLGRPWKTGARQAGEPSALAFSLGLTLAPQDWAGLSLAVGVGIAESLQPQLPAPGDAPPGLRLKWPNDLWIDGDRKLGGILVETASFGRSADAAGRYAIVGVGLNVVAPDAEGLSMPPAGLREIDPQLTAPEALARVAPALVQTLLGFAAYGFAPFAARFATRDVLYGRAITLSDGRSGTARGVAADGALQLAMPTGIESVTSADVSVRPTHD